MLLNYCQQPTAFDVRIPQKYCPKTKVPIPNIKNCTFGILLFFTHFLMIMLQKARKEVDAEMEKQKAMMNWQMAKTGLDSDSDTDSEEEEQDISK